MGGRGWLLPGAAFFGSCEEFPNDATAPRYREVTFCPRRFIFSLRAQRNPRAVGLGGWSAKPAPEADGPPIEPKDALPAAEAGGASTEAKDALPAPEAGGASTEVKAVKPAAEASCMPTFISHINAIAKAIKTGFLQESLIIS